MIGIASAVLMGTLSAHAADFEVGAGVDISADLPDGGLDQGDAQMGAGVTLRAPMRWTPHPAVAVRAEPFVGVHGGQDRVEWAQYGGSVSFASEDHWTLLSQVGFRFGPEFSPFDGTPFQPYIGSSLGLFWARHWHSFQGASAVLLDPETNDVNSGGNIDPYSDQVAPSVGAHIGVRFHELLPFAIEAELGYNVAFMSEASLSGARPALNAVRTAYGFNPVRIGVNAVFIR